MFAKIFYFLLAASLLYAYTRHNREVTASDSVIPQIWPGSCRLSCTKSGHSGVSGLSGLDQTQIHNPGSKLSDEVEQCQTSINNQACSSIVCDCKTCPCATLVTLFSPATTLYSAFIEGLFMIYFAIKRAFYDLCMTIKGVVTCRVSCQRPAQCPALKIISEDNFNDTSKELGKQILNLGPSSTSFRRESEDELAKVELPTSTGNHNIASKQPSDTLKLKSEEKENAKDSRTCTICKKRGAVCMKKCPTLKEKK